MKPNEPNEPKPDQPMSQDLVNAVLTKIHDWAPGLAQDHWFRCGIVAGGFVRDVLIGQEPADLDVFFPDQAARDTAVVGLRRLGAGHVAYSPKEHVATLRHGRNKIQYIFWKNQGISPSAIVRSFDFTVNAGCVYHDGTSFMGLEHGRFRQDTIDGVLALVNPGRTHFARVARFINTGRWKAHPDLLATLCAELRTRTVEDVFFGRGPTGGYGGPADHQETS